MIGFAKPGTNRSDICTFYNQGKSSVSEHMKITDLENSYNWPVH